MTTAQVEKLEMLLARVRQRAAEPRHVGALLASMAASRAGTADVVEDLEDDVLEDDVEDVTSIPPPLPPEAVVAAPPTEDEMAIEVSTDDVETEAAERDSASMPRVPKTSETHMVAHGAAPASDRVEVGADARSSEGHADSQPDLASADAQYEVPRHTPPPESGSQRAAPAETADASGQWRDAPPVDETQVRSTSRTSVAPASVPPASAPSARVPSIPSARMPSAPPASVPMAKVPSVPPTRAASVTPPPPPVAVAPPIAAAAAPASEPTLITRVVLAGTVFSTPQGALPVVAARGFDDLLSDTLSF